MGIVGAVVGGWLFSIFGAHGVTGVNLYSLFVAVIGAALVLVVYHAVKRGTSAGVNSVGMRSPGSNRLRGWANSGHEFLTVISVATQVRSLKQIPRDFTCELDFSGLFQSELGSLSLKY